MNLPFSKDQFFAVFAGYNEAVAPAQIGLLVLGIAAVILALRPSRGSDRTIGMILSVLWVWMGVVYHWWFFRAINPAAGLFGAVFGLEAGLLLWYFVIRRRATFGPPPGPRGWLALILLVYAFAVYPAVAYALGHRYPATPTFGLPCPTTIATLGLLLWTTRRPPLVVMVVPWLWALVGSSAAFQLGVHEDLGLLVALVISVWGWLVGSRAVRAGGISDGLRAAPVR